VQVETSGVDAADELGHLTFSAAGMKAVDDNG
jgi:hypothetical protein